MRRAALAVLLPLALAPTVRAEPPPAAPPAAGAPAPRAVEDRAAAMGIPVFDAGRCAAVDLDGDGDADLVVNAGRRVLRNDRSAGGTTFVDVTAQSGLAPAEGVRGADALAWGDVDGDGDLDCWYGRSRDSAPGAKEGKTDGLRSEIRLNDGAGHFARKEGHGVGEHDETVVTATFVDVDRDGVLDLFVGSWYVAYGTSLECFPPRLWLGRGDGTFREVTQEAGIEGVAEPGRRDSRRPVYGVTHADWDDDGDEDLLVCAYGRQWNVLWRNDGPGPGGVPRFTDVAEATAFDGDDDESGTYPPEIRSHPQLKDRPDEPPFRSNGNTFDAAVADVDDDGDLDVFLAEITHWWAGPSSDRSALLLNRGQAGAFAFAREDRGITRVHEGPRWNQGDLHAGWWDVGNDGRLDLFVASGDYPDRQRLRVWRQGPDHRFTDETDALGLDWWNCAQPTLADLDRDGTADLVVGDTNTRLEPAQREGRVLRLAAFCQHAPEAGWLRLTLEGRGRGAANRSAIGARVRVTVGDRTLTRVVTGCRGHAGHHDELALTIGLGPATAADAVEVRWPDAKGTVERTGRLEGRRAWRWAQGAGPAPDAR
ncbi:MAG: CRTAC1 family protein [Planctomycetes bacterium]|nr:CRTAC1 family protein [Planctomycetota bacterium]